jgi:UDP-N-acetylglucosamine--N-acetylmuramyl-(pentapeptide) pyrophosphoryl-undecaprenol N-acetylglucosamine transferase
MSRVLFAGGGTGGHLYPALALAAALKNERADVQVHFVGAKRGVEARVLPAEGQPHTLLPFEPLYRDRVWRNWRLVPSLWASALGLRRLFKSFNPGLVVGTGGYASAPACMYAISRGVPVAIQEQNSHPGLTTRTLSRWAHQIHLGFPEATEQLKPGKKTEVIVSGNPIRPPDRSISREAARASFGLRADSTVVLVTGGSQGSRALNEAIMGAWEHANMRNVELLWATGPSQIDNVRERVGSNPSVKLHGYISNMPHAMAASDLAVSRAGAMATAELLAWGIPAILVPLPTAAADHQTHNARSLADAGAAVMLLEQGLTGERMRKEIELLVNDAPRRAAMREAALTRARPNAARDIAEKLAKLL